MEAVDARKERAGKAFKVSQLGADPEMFMLTNKHSCMDTIS